MPDHYQLPRSYDGQQAEQWRASPSSASFPAYDTRVIAGESASAPSRSIHQHDHFPENDRGAERDTRVYRGSPRSPDRGGNNGTRGSDVGQPCDDRRYPGGEKDRWQEGFVGSVRRDGRDCSGGAPMDQWAERGFHVARSDQGTSFARRDTNSKDLPPTGKDNFARCLNQNNADAPTVRGHGPTPHDHSTSRSEHGGVGLQASPREVARGAMCVGSVSTVCRQQFTTPQSSEDNRYSDTPRTRSPPSPHTRNATVASRDLAPNGHSHRHHERSSKTRAHRSPSCERKSRDGRLQSAAAASVPPPMVARGGEAPLKRRILITDSKTAPTSTGRPKSWAEQQAMNKVAKMQPPPVPSPRTSRGDTTKNDALAANAVVQENVVAVDAAQPASLKSAQEAKAPASRDRSPLPRRLRKKIRKWQRAAEPAPFSAPSSPARSAPSCNRTRGEEGKALPYSKAVVGEKAHHEDACSANMDKVLAEMAAWGQHFMVAGPRDDFVKGAEPTKTAVMEEQKEGAEDVTNELASENDDEVPIPDDDAEKSKYWLRARSKGRSFLLCCSPAEREFLEHCIIDRIENRIQFFDRVHAVSRFCTAPHTHVRVRAAAPVDEREYRSKDRGRSGGSVMDDRRAAVRKRGLAKRIRKGGDHTDSSEETDDDAEREDTEDVEVDSPVAFHHKNDFKTQRKITPHSNSVAYYLGLDDDDDDDDYDSGMESEEGENNSDEEVETDAESDEERSELETFAFDDVSTCLIPVDTPFLADTENGALVDALRDRCNNVFSDSSASGDESDSSEIESNPDADHYDWETWANGQDLEDDLEKSKEANFKQFRSDAIAYGAVLGELLDAGVDPNLLDDILAVRATRSRSVSSVSSNSRSISRSCSRSRFSLRSRSSSRSSCSSRSYSSRSSHFCRSDVDAEAQVTGNRETNGSSAPAVRTIAQNNESRASSQPRRKTSEQGRRDVRKSERRGRSQSPRKSSRAQRRSEPRRGYSPRRSRGRREYLDNARSRRKEEGDWITVKPTEILFTQSTICTRFRDGKRILRCIDNPKELVDGGLRAIRYNGKLMSLSNRRLALFRLLELKGMLAECKAFLLRKIPQREFASKFTTTCGGRYVEMRNKDRYVFGMTRAETTYIQRGEILQRQRLENELAPKTGMQRHKQHALASEDAALVVQKSIAALKSEDITLPAPEPPDASATTSTSATPTASPAQDPATTALPLPRSASRRRPRSRTPRSHRVASSTSAPARARPSGRAATPPRHGDLPPSPPQTVSSTQQSNARPAVLTTTTPRAAMPTTTVPRTAAAATSATVPRTLVAATTAPVPRTMATTTTAPVPRPVPTATTAPIPRTVATATTATVSRTVAAAITATVPQTEAPTTTMNPHEPAPNAALQTPSARRSRLSAAAALRAQRGIIPKAARRRLIAAAAAAASLSGTRCPTIGAATPVAGSLFPPTAAALHPLHNIHQSSSSIPAGPQIVAAPIPSIHHHAHWRGLRSIPVIAQQCAAQTATARTATTHTDAAQTAAQSLSADATLLSSAGPRYHNGKVAAPKRGPARRRILLWKTRTASRQRVVARQKRGAAAPAAPVIPPTVTAKTETPSRSPKKQRLTDRPQRPHGDGADNQNVDPNTMHAAASKTGEHNGADPVVRTRNAADRKRLFITPRTVLKA
eukprot:GEMP01000461.1.p1 GENE.GEMP01000461.1~~GEMP01000461.1.p1  ORF type:complete len:1663 (+),score=447.57 GEMP01000461.1:54-5042(+)